ncbi:hypothetical protein R1flu_008580 [Riccia fluitans]|uniref:Uncharacterized protein n=1 Tax=Riccia fluitans TaxID=41844 RepID=A0ABD1YCR8_9MARC
MLAPIVQGSLTGISKEGEEGVEDTPMEVKLNDSRGQTRSDIENELVRPPLNDPSTDLANIMAIWACYIPPLIPIKIGDLSIPRTLVDIMSGVNVMSNVIRIRLGYHKMSSPMSKLAIADGNLMWPLGTLSSVPVVVADTRLIVSFQVMKVDDPNYTQLILGVHLAEGCLGNH